MNKKVDWPWLYLGTFLMVSAGEVEGFWPLIIIFLAAIFSYAAFTHSINKAIDRHKR